MATAILDVEMEQLPEAVPVPEGYARALVLARLRGKPVGQATLPVVGGRIGGRELRETLLRAAGAPLWERWLQEQLEWSPSSGAALPSMTVAVCTRDRPDDLRRCLEALLRLPDDAQELLVIDSCSKTEATRRVVAEFERVRLVREERPGLDIARNRAMRAASGEVVAFCDDDAVVDRGWLRALRANFADPRVLCVTGLTMPLELETEAQEWFERYSPFGRGFRRVVFESPRHSPLATGRIGAGANMALRRVALERVGAFDEALDAGTPTRSGGDHEMFTRILAAGYQIIYDPAALSWHRHRRTWEELRQTLHGYGVGVYALWTRHLLLEREWSVFQWAWSWFRASQLPALLRSLRGCPGSPPRDLLLAELRGCAAGPWAYLSSRRLHETGEAR